MLEDEQKVGKDPNLAEARDQCPPSHFTEGKKLVSQRVRWSVCKESWQQEAQNSSLLSTLVLSKTLLCFLHAFF